jgi:signal transduction histidine kinase
MKEPPVAQRSKAFRRRITLALAVLATLATLQGALALWAVALAEHHVLRGRVAADIKQELTSLWFDKQQLRNWLAERQFGAGATDDRRDALLRRMQDRLERLGRLATEAASLDDGQAARQRQVQRQDALLILNSSLEQLARGLASLNQPAPGLETSAAWRIANDLFDNAEGRDLRALLAESLVREDTSLREKRADTDKTLAWLRTLWVGTAAVLVLAALVLSFGFARALRTPLLALAEGAAALRDGRLSHRIQLDGATEFGEVAASMNTMAEELAAHRARELEARRALEETVAQRTAELTRALNRQTEAEARRRQLFADVSHELRTPTTAIRGEAQIALRGGWKPAEEYVASLHRIEDATRQLGSAIDDLLTMARTDIDTLSFRLEPIKFADVLDEAVSLGTALAQARGVELEAQPWPEHFAMVGDAARLRQLLLVLIDNAVRYSPTGGTVRLTALRAGTANPVVELSIADEGIGIAPQDLATVFERGFRASNARLHCVDGSGLGLPIARLLARSHGGEVEIKSVLAVGTVALVSLPLAQS